MGCAVGTHVHPHPPAAPPTKIPSARQQPVPPSPPGEEPRTKWPQGCDGHVFTDSKRSHQLLHAAKAWGHHHCPRPSELACLLDLGELACALGTASPLPSAATERSTQCYSSYWLVLLRSQHAFLSVTTVKPKLRYQVIKKKTCLFMNNGKETGCLICFGDRVSCLQSCGTSAVPCE